MYRFGGLAVAVCCAILAVASAYPLVEDDAAVYEGDVVPVEHLTRLARKASAVPPRSFYRPHTGGFGGFGRQSFGGFGGSGGSYSNANSVSFSSQFNTPFGGFSASASNSFGGGGYYGRR